MKGTINQGDLEINTGKSGQNTFLSGFNDAFFNRRNVCFGNCSTHNGIDELKALAPGQGFHLNPAIAKLTVAAGLFLVLTLNPDLLFDGFSKRNFGGSQHGLDIKFSFELFDGGFNMNLPQARYNDFFGFRNPVQP